MSRARRPRRAGPPPRRRRRLPLALLAIVGVVVVVAAGTAVALDLPRTLATGAGEAIGRAGFAVRRVDVQGIQRMDSKPVYRIAFGQRSTAMPLVDVAAIREELLGYGWVKDARVSRRLPDTLVIDIVERRPAALWQHRQQLALIDTEGVVLERLRVDQMPDLPLLIGPGANDQAVELNRLLARVPTLKPQLASATWVGGRRWDLQFTSGETVALPEGEGPAGEALRRFAKVDKSTGLLGRGLVRFDLRIPGKMVVRLPRAPGEPIEQPAPSES